MLESFFILFNTIKLLVKDTDIKASLKIDNNEYKLKNKLNIFDKH